MLSKDSQNIILAGPLSEKVTGQSLAFKIVRDNVRHSMLINTSKFNNKILSTLFVILKCPFLLFQPTGSVLYFTCSRSNFGFIKDFFIIWTGHIKSMTIINHLHGSDFDAFTSQKGIMGSIIRKSYRKISHTILLMKEMEDQLVQFPESEYSVIPNCYEEVLDKFTYDYRKTEEIVITYLSNLIYSKGIIVFLDSAISILDQGYKVKFKIAGEFMDDIFYSAGTMRLELYSRLKISHNWSGSIEYLGPMYGESKYKLLAESSIFALPSFYKSEAFPISIIEAMRTGNAIITTEYKYLPFLINETNGAVVKVNDSESLEKAIVKLIDDKDKLSSMQQNNIENAVRKYSQEEYLNKLNALFITQHKKVKK